MLSGLVIVGGPIQASNQTSLADTLDCAGKYVHQFEQDFALVISDEDYLQTDQPRPGNTGYVSWGLGGMSLKDPKREPLRREIRSEMLFVRQEGTWLAVRNVLWIRDDRATFLRTIPDSKGRLDRALKDTSPGQAARLRSLADESARFNLGHIYRNFNIPTLALQFLALEFQPRFTFTVASHEKVSGSSTVKIEFAERQSPTVITLNDKRDVFATGLLWVRESDGAVLRTRLIIKAPQTADGPGLDDSVNVDYRHDSKLNMWVLRHMEEEYAEVMTGGERITCAATYTNFRRFETSGRLVVPK